MSRVTLIETIQMITLITVLSCIAACGGIASHSELSKEISTTIERIEISEDLYLRRIEEGVYIITHSFPWAANSMLVEIGDSSLVLVDTPYTPEATRSILEWTATEFENRHLVAINTGYHHDNLGGNAYLMEEGIPVYGSELTARLLEERGDEMRRMTLDWLSAPEYERYLDVHRTLVYVTPSHLFRQEDGLSLTVEDEIVQVHYPGPTHSPDNVVVYFPDRKVLFGGCMIIGMNQLGNTSDADMESWPEAVRSLSQFDFDVLVPGHGNRFDPGLLEHTIHLLCGIDK